MTVLADQTWPEAAAARSVLAVPLGSTEQHGPHLPLSTDTDIATALAARAAAAMGDLVVAPAQPYGSSGEHQAFAGTLSVGQSVTELLVIELVRSASAAFRRVVLVSAHGGNEQPVARAVRRLRDEGHDVRAWSPALVWAGDAHAGRVETSVMLALHPERVRVAVAVPGDTRPLGEVLGTLRAQGVAGVSANGVLGDPTGASAIEGEALLDRATAALVAALEAWPSSDGSWL